jgi:DNA-binding NarL/FixJ family response regulator
MNYFTAWFRRKKGTDMNLPINFHQKWKARMPDVAQMIQQGLLVKHIAKHYQCAPSTVVEAVTMHSIGVNRLKQKFRAEGTLCKQLS